MKLLIVFLLAASQQTFANDLQGVWRADCQESLDGDFQINEVTFTADTAVVESQSFSDADCSTKNLQISISLNYTAGTKNDEGLIEVDTVSTGLSIAPTSEAALEWMNAETICGKSDWVLNEASPLTDCGSYKEGSTTYSIAKQSGNSLQLGIPTQTHDGSTTENRVQQLDTIVFTKVTE